MRRSAAPGRHVYDVVVVGGQLSGIITTALLAKHGMQVLHVPHDGLSEPYGEMKLPHAPLLLPPLKSVPAFEEVMTELGLTNVLGRQTHTAPLQLLESDNWFELTHDEKRRGPELARALGDGAEVFDELVRSAEHAANASDAFFVSKPDFPPEGLLARWKFKRSLTRFPALDTDTPLPQSALLRRLVPFIGTNESALSRARVLGRVLTGPALFPGGREGLWQALAERARELGAQVLAGDEPVQRITPESGGVTVRLVHHDVNYRAGFVAAAMDLDVLTALITEKQQKAAAKIVGNVTAARALFVLNLVLPEKALPRGLGTLALLHAPSLEGGAALLSVLPAVNADQRVLSVCTPAPLALRSGGEPAINALIAQVHAELERVMPFTKQHVIAASTPWLDAPRVAEGAGEPAPLYEPADNAWLGVAGHTTRSPWKRVALASRQVLPGLGFEGEVLAAQRAVSVIEATLKKQDLLKAKTGS